MSAPAISKIVDLRGRPLRRGFAAAEADRLTADFLGTSASIDNILSGQLVRLRNRSRQLAMDNDYARRFLAMVKANVVGSTGIGLQSRAQRRNGNADEKSRRSIEQHWLAWSRAENCTMSGRLSWRDVQRLVIETVARDGECLIRIIRGSNLPYGIALHVLEPDYLDEKQNIRQPERIVSLGVEQNSYGRPLRYHLLTQHPGAGVYTQTTAKHELVDAADILHLYLVDRPGQSRGYPWLTTAIRRLHMLGGYEQAELVAARVAASKMGFYTSPDGEAVVGEKDASGNLLKEVEPGVFEQLPVGTSFETFDPQHPTTAFQAFTKAVLRGAASGLGVSYNTLSNDLEGVNYSSIRSGVLEEREQWRLLQGWFIDAFCEPIFHAWLKSAVLPATSPLGLNPEQLDRYMPVKWQPRGWAWVDPLKDQQANREALALGVTTRSDIAASQGKDLEETFEQLQREKAMAMQYELDLEPTNGGTTNAAETD